MRRITVHLVTREAARAAAWYAEALGAEERGRIEVPGGTATVLHLETAEVDSLWERALAAGAEVRQPLADTFWGERYGQIVDPFGHRWGLAQRVRDVPRQEVQRAAAALFAP
jgi:PhnB protein